jgi:hypothetical protein
MLIRSVSRRSAGLALWTALVVLVACQETNSPRSIERAAPPALAAPEAPAAPTPSAVPGSQRPNEPTHATAGAEAPAESASSKPFWGDFGEGKCGLHNDTGSSAATLYRWLESTVRSEARHLEFIDENWGKQYLDVAENLWSNRHPRFAMSPHVSCYEDSAGVWIEIRDRRRGTSIKLDPINTDKGDAQTGQPLRFAVSRSRSLGPEPHQMLASVTTRIAVDRATVSSVRSRIVRDSRARRTVALCDDPESEVMLIGGEGEHLEKLYGESCGGEVNPLTAVATGLVAELESSGEATGGTNTAALLETFAAQTANLTHVAQACRASAPPRLREAAMVLSFVRRGDALPSMSLAVGDTGIRLTDQPNRAPGMNSGNPTLDESWKLAQCVMDGVRALAFSIEARSEVQIDFRSRGSAHRSESTGNARTEPRPTQHEFGRARRVHPAWRGEANRSRSEVPPGVKQLPRRDGVIFHEFDSRQGTGRRILLSVEGTIKETFWNADRSGTASWHLVDYDHTCKKPFCGTTYSEAQRALNMERRGSTGTPVSAYSSWSLTPCAKLPEKRFQIESWDDSGKLVGAIMTCGTPAKDDPFVAFMDGLSRTVRERPKRDVIRERERAREAKERESRLRELSSAAK